MFHPSRDRPKYTFDAAPSRRFLIWTSPRPAQVAEGILMPVLGRRPGVDLRFLNALQGLIPLRLGNPLNNPETRM